MEKSGLFAFGTSWWEPFLKADSKTSVEFISLSQTDQNKYNSLVKDGIIGMLTAFKLLSHIWDREKGPFFKGEFLPQKWDLKSSIETQHISVQKHVSPY
jgi:hypothetical protein